jgi:transcriptional regulator with XRE-family HTH domain
MPFQPGEQTDVRTKLAAWRVKRGVTQNAMAEAVGVSRATYVRLEQGRNDNPPVRLLVNCAIALGCELDDLIEDEWRAWYTPAGIPPSSPPSTLWTAEGEPATRREREAGRR